MFRGIKFEFKAFKLYREGFYTTGDFLRRCADLATRILFDADTNFYRKHQNKELRNLFWNEKDKTYHIKDVKFPQLDSKNENALLSGVFEDTFKSYFYYNDKYDEKTFTLCEKTSNEGPYGLVNDKVNVTVEPGDIVIDAGSWIGDFAAYASVKGAQVYAFEPIENIFKVLEKTAELNGNIIPVKKGLSDENVSKEIFTNENSITGSTFIDTLKRSEDISNFVETVRLDDFVRENNIPRVDFIKADIEGSERNMLKGAQETLRRFAPKLALCTYHLPDDPEVMADLIKQANPNYNIVHKKKKLFASVPK